MSDCWTGWAFIVLQQQGRSVNQDPLTKGLEPRLCVFVCSRMCVAVTAQWYKRLVAPARSLHHTETERKRKKAPWFVSETPLFQASISHLSPTQSFLSQCIPVFCLCYACVIVMLCWGCGLFCQDWWCDFKVLIDVQSPYIAGSCCQRSQPIVVPVSLEWRSHLDPCQQVMLGLWKEQYK